MFFLTTGRGNKKKNTPNPRADSLFAKLLEPEQIFTDEF